MQKASKIKNRLQLLLSESFDREPELVTSYLQTIEWIGFAQQYSDAAKALEDRIGPVSELPRLLLSGHSIECALKACIVSKSQNVPQTHDLVVLADSVIELGFVLFEPELVSIVNLANVFFEDLVSKTRFRVRYPTKHVESNIRDSVSHQLLARIVTSLTEQASKYNEYANRENWSG